MNIDLDIDNKTTDIIVEKTQNGFRISTIEIKDTKVLIDYTSSYLLDTECQTVYKDKNGRCFVKKTKYPPVNRFSKGIYDSYLRPGMTNDYGHTVVDSYYQYKFKIW